ncbi:hypothetical protein ISF_03107 [Cordyceps fumosorosea ARSEF 2679]|uniref:Uncharacterized protein n=1 Tax=Cordyceps fumosorosea (strain ARSEF 2679) TaxID=1081104 RepID=A0A168BA70_CORFA|nr:hypothetical protein ISF_03107 [Cordyceps fumosorosea ARSEF 2679]OAA69837.1 hypothetical protein ISF_03107 [Cordyceps fumosorosea ARSEF 2679]
MRKSAIDETLSRPTSNSGSPSRRITQTSHHLQQPQQHRIRKGSQSRRKSNCSSTAQSRSSLEPDADLMASPAPSSVAGSPYSLASSFATISEGGAGDFAATLSVPYDSPGAVGMTAQHMPYSMPYHDCGYQSGAAWPPAASYQRGDPGTSAGLNNSFISTVSNPDAFPVLTPPDEYMQFQAFASLQTAGADIWPYHR